MPSLGTETVNSMPELELALRRELDSIRVSKRNALIGTGILALVMISYLTYMYKAINLLVEEESLAGQAQAYVRQSLPQAEGRIREAMLVSLPHAVDQGFDVAIANIPSVGEQIELYVEEKVEKAFRTAESKLDAQFGKELTDLHKKAIAESMDEMAHTEGREALEKKLAAQLEKRYRQEAVSKLLPEFFEGWTTITAESAMRVFIERLQAFDVELRQLCNSPPGKLRPADLERKQMVLCMTAYLESLFAQEGDRLVERVFYLLETSTEKMDRHFVGRTKRSAEEKKPQAALKDK